MTDVKSAVIRVWMVMAAALGLPGLAAAQGALTSGATHTGAIDVAGQTDDWTFIAAPGQTVIVAVGEILRVPDSGFSPVVRLFDPAGAQQEFDSSTLAVQVVHATAMNGTYTVRVSSSNANVGDYRVSFVQLPGTFVTSPGDEGGTASNGENHSGRIEHGDLDMWSFHANANDSFVLSLTEVPPPPGTADPGFVPWIRVYGPNGANIINGSDTDTAQVVYRALVDGEYTVVAGTVTASGNAGRNGVGDYILRLAKVPGVFTTPAGDQGGALANGSNQAGYISLGDLDIWTFDAGVNDAIVVSMTEVPLPPGTIDPVFVPWIRLYGPNGANLVNDSNSVTAQVFHQAVTAGTYTVIAGTLTASANAGRTGIGDYILRLAKVPGAFNTPVGDHGGTMTAGVDYAGRIELGDLDLWQFQACAGNTINLQMTEVPGASSIPDFVPWIRLFGPNGDYLRGGSGTLTASLLESATVTGAYTVIAGTLTASGNAGRDGFGNYLLKLLGTCPVPASVNDSYSTPFNTALVVPPPGVMANDANVASATVAVVTGVSHGTLVLNTNGGFTYTPPNGFSGTASFTYRATNAAGPGNVASVSIAVQAATPPTAVDDAYPGTQEQTLVVTAPGVLGNDNANGGGAMSATIVTPTTHGGVILNADGSFSYTPTGNFVGPDTFTYRVSNANGTSTPATVSITVSSPTTAEPPTGLIAHSIAGNTVTLRWRPPAAGIAPTSYVMEGGVVPGQTLASIPTGSAMPVFTFGAPNGAFYLRIKTVAGGQTSVASNEIRVFVNTPAPPSAPSHLVGLVNGQQVALAWRNTFAGGTPSAAVLDVTGTLSTSLPLGLTDTFVFNGVPGGTYTFSVRAMNGSGSSGPSNPVTLSFPGPCSGAPGVPEDFLAYRSGNTVNLLWDPAGAGAATTSFVLNVSGAFNGTLPMPSRGISAAVPPGSYTLTVSAVNPCGTSAPTAPQTVIIP